MKISKELRLNNMIMLVMLVNWRADWNVKRWKWNK